MYAPWKSHQYFRSDEIKIELGIIDPQFYWLIDVALKPRLPSDWNEVTDWYSSFYQPPMDKNFISENVRFLKTEFHYEISLV